MTLKSLLVGFFLLMASTASAQRMPGGNSSVITLETIIGSVCSAAVIGPNVVLTAKHCVMSEDMEGVLDPIEIRVGHFGTYYYGRELFVPANNGLSDDVAILVVRGNIPLPALRISHEPVFNSEPVVVVGYGVVPGIPPGVKSHMIVQVDDLIMGMITVPPSICRGDSGSPLLNSAGEIIGVASFIFSTTPNPVCMEAPGAYAGLYQHLAWIDYTLTLASTLHAQSH